MYDLRVMRWVPDSDARSDSVICEGRARGAFGAATTGRRLLDILEAPISSTDLFWA